MAPHELEVKYSIGQTDAHKSEAMGSGVLMKGGSKAGNGFLPVGRDSIVPLTVSPGVIGVTGGSSHGVSSVVVTNIIHDNVTSVKV